MEDLFDTNVAHTRATSRTTRVGSDLGCIPGWVDDKSASDSFFRSEVVQIDVV